MAELKNAHGSLLAFSANVAKEFDIEAINLDAVADEVDLPQTDFIGLQGFALASANDYQPLAVVSGMITVATRNDANNMKLIERLDAVYELLQPENLMDLFSMESGEKIGDFKVFGTTRVLPVTRMETLAMQSVTFQAALQYVE